MSSGAIALAYTAGAIAAFNPCGFALLPSWAAYLVAGEDEANDELLARLWRALRAGGLATLSFLILFGAAGLLFSVGFSVLGKTLPWLGLTIGVVLAGLGALLAMHGQAPGLRVGRKAEVDASARAVLGFGAAYGLASLSCVLPAFVLTIGIAAGEPLRTRAAGFTGFALGMGTVLTLVAVGAALARSMVANVGHATRHVPRVAGVVILLAAVWVIERELGLAAITLGDIEPSQTRRVAVAAAVTIIASALALAISRIRKTSTPLVRRV